MTRITDCSPNPLSHAAAILAQSGQIQPKRHKIRILVRVVFSFWTDFGQARAFINAGFRAMSGWSGCFQHYRTCARTHTYEGIYYYSSL